MRFAFEWCGYRYRDWTSLWTISERTIDEIEEEKWWWNSIIEDVESGIVMNLIRSSTIQEIVAYMR